MGTAPNRFTGIAYWRMQQAPDNWVDTVGVAVRPLCEQGLATSQVTELGAGRKELVLTLTREGESLSMQVKDGQGRGVVPNTSAALPTVMCLMAMRKQLPFLFLVDDNQSDIPYRVSQQFPLFAEDWTRTLEYAQLLGFAPSQRFLDAEGAVMHLMF